MKILLVYPQQADQSKHRLSRSDAQLNGITQTVQALLERCTEEKYQLSEFAYEQIGKTDTALDRASNQQTLKSTLADADLVIDVSSTSGQIVQQADFEGPVIHLAPTFNGSFVCNDIAIKGCGQLLQSDVVQYIDQSREPYLDLLPSTHELDANMHYSAFSPLPTRVGDAFYRTPNDHALVFLNFPPHLNTKETIDTDQQVLANILHSVESLKSVTFVCESLADVPLVRQVADELEQALGLKASIWGLRKGDYHDLFSVMAKSNLVLFGGNSLFADAIIRGIPVYPWRSELPGIDNIAQDYQQFWTNQTSTRNALLSAQREHLDQLIEAQYLDASVPNHRACFDEILCSLISHVAKQQSFSVIPADDSFPNWVIEPAREPVSRSLPDRLSRSVWSNGKKILKFKHRVDQEIVSGQQERPVFTNTK